MREDFYRNHHRTDNWLGQPPETAVLEIEKGSAKLKGTWNNGDSKYQKIKTERHIISNMRNWTYRFMWATLSTRTIWRNRHEKIEKLVIKIKRYQQYRYKSEIVSFFRKTVRVVEWFASTKYKIAQFGLYLLLHLGKNNATQQCIWHDKHRMYLRCSV